MSSYLVLWLVAVFCARSAAAAVNISIDDNYGDAITGVPPTYINAVAADDNWQYGPSCNVCAAVPNASLASNGSWHDITTEPPTTVVPAVSVTFNGTGVYAYCILANGIPGSPFTTTSTQLFFSIDGESVGNFTHVSDGSGNYQYNQSVYANSALPDGLHNFTMFAGDNKNVTLVLFDYILYTTGSSSPGSSRGSPIHDGVIAGSVVGGVAALALIGLIGWYALRRSRRRTSSFDPQMMVATPRAPGQTGVMEIEPFMGQAPSTTVLSAAGGSSGDGNQHKNRELFDFAPTSAGISDSLDVEQANLNETLRTQARLQAQMRQMEDTIASLRARAGTRTAGSSAGSSSSATAASQGGGGHRGEDLHRQIEDLRNAVADLQEMQRTLGVEMTSMSEAPPTYRPADSIRGSEGTHVEAI